MSSGKRFAPGAFSLRRSAIGAPKIPPQVCTCSPVGLQFGHMLSSRVSFSYEGEYQKNKIHMEAMRLLSRPVLQQWGDYIYDHLQD